MTMKRAFEKFLTELEIAPSARFNQMSPPDFGSLFFDFARSHGYDIANNASGVLERLAVDVKEVLDVGVHEGTPWLYKRFPDARFILIEPQRHAEHRLKHKPATYSFVSKAVGSSPGKLTLTEMGERSSLLARAGEHKDMHGSSKKAYLVDVDTLDRIIDDSCKTESIGIKLDIEGYEYHALCGLSSNIRRIRFIILEASIRERFHGERTFGDLSHLLMTKGFRFYNLLNTARPVPPNAYDMIFLPEGHENFQTTSSI